MLSCIWPLPFLGNGVGGILLLGLGKPEQPDMNESRGGVFYIRIHAIRCLHTYRIVGKRQKSGPGLREPAS